MAINTEKIQKDIYEAYVYAYPAVILELTRRTYLNPSKDGSKIPKTNTFHHNTVLADASFKNVVAPNIDTIYSQAWLDLSEGALILEKPELDRYVSIAFLDAYTNCEHLIGTGGDGNQAERYLITGPDFADEIPEGYKQVALPTNRNWGLIRTIIYDKDDLEAVKEIQSRIQFKVYGNAKQEVIYPLYDSALDFKPIEKITNLSLEQFFEIFNGLLEQNRDKYAPVQKLEQWKNYGIGVGETFTDDKEIREAIADIPKAFIVNTSRGLAKRERINNWNYPDASIGIYKTNFELRANVARSGLGANPVTMCIYPGTYHDSQGEPLDGTKSYQLHFEKGQLPPVYEFGFWSITLYDNRERYLVENELHRYGINDRDAFQENQDGSIDILIQHERPEETQVSNWLPSAKEPFNLILRIYLAKEEAISGDWKPPIVREIKQK